MGCKHRRAMRFSLPTVTPDAVKNTTERKLTVEEPRKNASVSKYISCRNCKIESCDVFGSLAERDWFAVIDATGEYCKECRHELDACTCRTYHNPGKKVIYCSPYCWLVKRGSVANVDLHQQIAWCREHGKDAHCVKLAQLFTAANAQHPQK